MKRPFRIITSKQILSQVCPGDWFFSLDLKDAYQYTVLPFGLSLAPSNFTKCMDAALSLLRQLGIHILNYLDDWLILTQSEDEILYHRSVLLSHLECLGLRVNFAKSALSPSQLSRIWLPLTTLQLHITHGLQLPSFTALQHTHSHPPLHQSHSCHQSLISLDCLATPAPHSLTHI